MSEIPATNGSAATNGSTSTDGADAPLRLGGMAMRNGLLVHGPTSWAAAARNSKTGAVEVASGRKPNFGGNLVAKVPLLRGPVRMAEAFAVIPVARGSLRSARLPFEDPRVIVAAAGVSLANAMLRRRAAKEEGGSTVGGEAVSTALGMVPAIVALSGSELASLPRRRAQGDRRLRARQPRSAHRRQGAPALRLEPDRPDDDLHRRRPGDPRPAAEGAGPHRPGGRLARQPLARGRDLRLRREHPESPAGRAVHWAGDTIQRLFATREPNEEQIEVGVAAMDAILAAEGAD